MTRDSVMDMRSALELIAAPMRPDGTWNRDRAACQAIAAQALGLAAVGQVAPTVRPLVARLRAAALPGTARNALDEEAACRIEILQRALHEVAEELAGAECGDPIHAQEAYAIGLAKRMATLAREALNAR